MHTDATYGFLQIHLHQGMQYLARVSHPWCAAACADPDAAVFRPFISLHAERCRLCHARGRQCWACKALYSKWLADKFGAGSSVLVVMAHAVPPTCGMDTRAGVGVATHPVLLGARFNFWGPSNFSPPI